MNKLIRWQYGVIVIFLLFIAACARIPADWRGVSSKHLFRVYGYPGRVARLKKGYCLLIYRRKASACTASFTVNREKRITDVRYRGGEQCESEFKKGRER